MALTYTRLNESSWREQ